MTNSLLVDTNLDGHARRIKQRMYSSEWLEYSEFMNVEILYFEDVDLDRNAPDNVVWRLCQERGYWLLTANRNEDAEDSLETTIRNEGTFESLPVLTLADANRLLFNMSYLDKIIERLFDCLMSRNVLLGSGRKYLP
jgi:hypothetical protein